MTEKVRGWPETPVTSKARRGMVLRCSTGGCEGEWTNAAIAPPDRVRKWATENGWEITKGFRSAQCPGCIGAKETEVNKAVETGALSKNLRLVVQAVGEHYDDQAHCYEQGWDDAKIAANIDLSPAYVAKVREACFGPAEDPRIGQLRVDINEARRAMKAECDELRAMLADCERRWSDQIDDLGSKLAGLLR